MIRVAHFSRYMGVGGIEQCLLQMCRYRDRERYSFAIATTEDGPMADEIRSTGTPVFNGPDAFHRAAAHADLINLHWGEYNARFLDLARRARKPLVTTVHDRFPLPALPTVNICTSRDTLAIQPHPERCVAISNGVDVASFAARHHHGDGRLVITRICRPPKCAPYFWSAARRLLERFPSLEIRIVGNPRPCTHPDPRVRFLGVRRDIPEILAETDLFLYTPYPGLGTRDLVVMEAAAAGVPAVVSDVSAVRESIRDGSSGFLTPYGDEEALVARVTELLKDSGLRAQMGRNARQLALAEFDARVVARRYETVYRTVLDATRHSPG